MKRILITGATGEVAAPLAKMLVKRGHKVSAIARGNSRASAAERIYAATECSEINVLEGDITKPFCGLQDHDDAYDIFIHSAAMTKFDQRLADITTQTNIQGTAHALALAEHLQIPHFHYISTAYIAGNRNIFYESDHGELSQARNPYEHSKQQAESLVRAWTKGTTYIHRLSVVVGDSQTGKSQHYKSFYGYIRTFWQYQEALQPLSQEAPFLLRVNPRATLNLIPIDWVTNTLVNLLEQSIPNGTYHLTHPTPQSFAWLIKNICQQLDTQMRCADMTEPAPTHVSKEWQQAQKLIDRILRRYDPYVQSEPIFDNRQLQDALKSYYEVPPTVTRTMLGRWVDDAIRNNFGRR